MEVNVRVMKPKEKRDKAQFLWLGAEILSDKATSIHRIIGEDMAHKSQSMQAEANQLWDAATDEDGLLPRRIYLKRFNV